LALESHQNNPPINLDKLFKYDASSPFFFSRQNCTLIVFDLSFFFLFGILLHFFFSNFPNTSNCLNPEFHNFYPTNFNFISKNSQHRIKNRGILILELKTVLRNFKNTMELIYKNLCGSITQA